MHPRYVLAALRGAAAAGDPQAIATLPTLEESLREQARELPPDLVPPECRPAFSCADWPDLITH